MKIIYACFRLWKRPFCCRRQTIFNKKHHLQLWLSKINKNHHFGSILTQNWEKQQQRAPKSFICNETHPLQVIQAHDYTFRQVFNFHDLVVLARNHYLISDPIYSLFLLKLITHPELIYHFSAKIFLNSINKPLSLLLMQKKHHLKQ